MLWFYTDLLLQRYLTLNFREANVNDLSELLEIEQCLIDFERPFNAVIKSKNTIYCDFPHLISDDDSYLLVVELSGEIIGTGYAQIRDSREELIHRKHSYIGFIFVSLEHRGKALSQKIIERLIEWSKSKRVNDFYLNVYSQNKTAIKAYEKAGFKPGLVEMRYSI
jgi:GNAT superfamily N-acetyltransferase